MSRNLKESDLAPVPGFPGPCSSCLGLAVGRCDGPAGAALII